MNKILVRYVRFRCTCDMVLITELFKIFKLLKVYSKEYIELA
jgi:hypothetical protein